MGDLLPHAGMGKQLAAAAAPPCSLGGHVLCGRGPPVLTVLRPVEGVLASMGSSRSQQAGRDSVCTPQGSGAGWPVLSSGRLLSQKQDHRSRGQGDEAAGMQGSLTPV